MEKKNAETVKSTRKSALGKLRYNPLMMHSFFKFCRKEFSPENFCCFYLLDAYISSPHKRMADFIIDNYTKEPNDPLDRKYGVFTAPLNLPTSVAVQFVPSLSVQGIVSDPRSDLKSKYAHIPKTFSEKKQQFGSLGALKMKLDGRSKPDSEMFMGLYAALTGNLLDSYSRFIVEKDSGAPDGGDQLIEFRKDIRSAGWIPEMLGIWN